MPRLLPSEKCQKCQGRMKRQPSMVVALYACEKCDAGDPLKTADQWTKGELKPPE